MLKPYSDLKAILLLIIISVAITHILFYPISSNPNEYLFSGGGDGIKNYYSPAFFVKHDRGIWSESMNYPYGEHIIFTDGQPGISIPLRFINNHIISLDNHIIGILNLLMIYSLIPAIFFMFLILRHFRLPLWYAFIVSILIAFSDPQFQRIGSHYALSYVFVVPMVWYLLIRLMNATKRKWIWVAILSLAVFWASLLHVYYLLLSITFIGGALFVYLFKRKTEQQNWLPNLISLFLVMAIPFIAFNIFTNLTDPFTDRPENPWGFFHYRAYFATTFFTLDNSFLKLLKVKTNYSPESHEYIGSIGIFILVLIIAKWIGYLRKKQFRKLALPASSGYLQIFFWSAILVYLFANTLPFGLGLEWLLDYLPKLKQFRSLGRLVWVFYFVFITYGFVLFYSVFRLLKIKKLYRPAQLFIMILFASMAIDGYVNVKTPYPFIKKASSNRFYNPGSRSFFTEHQLSAEAFQAILALPMSVAGNEYLQFIRGGNAQANSMAVAYETGLSLVAPFASRSSVSRSFKILQLISNQKIKKTYPTDLKSQKPFLLIATNEPLSKTEQFLINQAKPIGEINGNRYFSLPVASITDSSAWFYDYFEKTRDSLFAYNGAWAVDTPSFFLYNPYDSVSTSHPFAGRGAFEYEQQKFHVLFDQKIKADQYPLKLEVSIWLMANPERPAFPVLRVKKYDVNGYGYYEWDSFLKSDPMDISGRWLRVSHIFTVDNADETIQIRLEGNKIIADELMIKAVNENIYTHPSDSLVMMNNFPVQP
jgi:hypothetical protein